MGPHFRLGYGLATGVAVAAEASAGVGRAAGSRDRVIWTFGSTGAAQSSRNAWLTKSEIPLKESRPTTESLRKPMNRSPNSPSSKAWALCLLSALAACLTGCANAPLVNHSMARLRLAGVEMSTLHRAVVVNAHEQGWRVEHSKRHPEQVVAFEPELTGYALPTRPRWVFFVKQGQVSARRFLEVREGSEWRTWDLVCSDYSRARGSSAVQNRRSRPQSRLVRQPVKGRVARR